MTTETWDAFVEADEGVRDIWVLPQYASIADKVLHFHSTPDVPPGVMAFAESRRLTFTHWAHEKGPRFLLAELRGREQFVIFYAVSTFDDDLTNWESATDCNYHETDWVTDLRGVGERWWRTLLARIERARFERDQATKKMLRCQGALDEFRAMLDKENTE